MSLARYIGTNNVDRWVNEKVTKLTTCETSNLWEVWDGLTENRSFMKFT